MFRVVLLCLLFCVSHLASAEKNCKSFLTKAKMDQLAKQYKKKNKGKSPFAIGIEIEGLVPKEISYAEVAKKVKNTIKDHLPDRKVTIIKVSHDLYSITFEKNNLKYVMQVTSDYTVHEPANKKSVEIISAILRDQSDIILYKKIIKALKNTIEFNSTPIYGGVHVHADFSKSEAAEIAMLVAAFSIAEKGIYKAFAVDDNRREQFANWTSEKVLNYIKATKAKKLDVNRLVLNSEDRFRGLNLVNTIQKLQTVEFRFFNSTIDMKNLDLILEFSTKFVQAVRTKDKAFLEFLKENIHVEEISFVELAQVLNIENYDGEESTDRFMQEAWLSLFDYEKNPSIVQALRTSSVILN